MEDRHQGPGLGIGKPEVAGDERQKHIEYGGDPMGAAMAEADQEDGPLALPFEAGQSFDGGDQRGLLFLGRP